MLRSNKIYVTGRDKINLTISAKTCQAVTEEDAADWPVGRTVLPGACVGCLQSIEFKHAPLCA
jgi:hypothetical protein